MNHVAQESQNDVQQKLIDDLEEISYKIDSVIDLIDVSKMVVDTGLYTDDYRNKCIALNILGLAIDSLKKTQSSALLIREPLWEELHGKKHLNHAATAQ
ncbi:MAG: hypothetical protein RIB59_11065 [Rhodospirillales bacterium]